MSSERFLQNAIFVFLFLFILVCSGCGNNVGSTSFASTPSTTSTPTTGTTAGCGSSCSASNIINAGNGVWNVRDASCGCVNAAIAAASKGDTIQITATGSVTWPSYAVVIPTSKPLKILGPGKGNLTINISGDYAFVIDPYVGTDSLPATRISGFKFLSPYESRYIAIVARGKGWRVDNCAYESLIATSPGSTFVMASGINTDIQPAGVVDSNTIINGMVINVGMALFSDMSISWLSDPGLGTSDALYIEDNIFSSSNVYEQEMADTNRGGRYVFRYNTTSNGSLLSHSLQADTERGSRKWEIYGNKFQSLSDNTFSAIEMLSGTGVIFGNDFTSASGHPYDITISFWNKRSETAIGFAGKCNGTSVWDGNLDSTGWPCRDQVGTGIDAFQWLDLSSGIGAPSQSLLPVYTWNNVEDGSLARVPVVRMTYSPNHIKSNRDYYVHNKAFDGTGGTVGGNGGGVGCGTLANRPTTCSVGVAYWATNQSCADSTDMVGVQPSTPIAGTLYKCISINTWTAYYTPYTYPHPLRQ